MNHLPFLGRILLVSLLAATTGLGQQPPAVPTSKPLVLDDAGDGIKINMPGSSVDDVLTLIERWTGKILLRPQNLPNATLSLVIKDPISKREAVQAVETLLNLNGIALTPLGERFLKVTPLNAVKSEAPEFIEGTALNLTPSGRTASKLFTLQFLRVSEFMPQISGLLNPAAGSPPVVFDKANAALITDSVSNLQRIETLVAKLDQPALAGLSSKFYQLQNGAKASDVVNKLRTILSGQLQTQLGSSTTFNADDRTNQIILVSDPRQIPLFDDLIAKLDVKSDPNTRNDVIQLKHAAAKEVAPILSQLVSGQNTAAKSAGQDNVTRAPTAPAQPAAQPAVAAIAAAVASQGLGLETGANQFSALLTILPDERTNSLVVSGTLDDIRLIKELVAKIDILLAQVRIEVVIAEVTLNDNATSGISALGLTITGDKLNKFSGAAGGISVSDGVLSYPGVVGAGPLDLAATINLATTPRKSNANILSVPNIITTHNKEGHIFVGEQRPIVSNYINSGSAGVGSTGNNGSFSSNVTYKDIGIDLKVKPLIGTDGAVQLEITQEVNDILGNVNIGGNDQPRIGRRSTESFVSAQSGEIIVLGGLQRTSKSKGTNRLGPIPFLGDLLGTRTREDTRTDLVFFLRPTVLTNTSADNAEALRRIEQLPKEPREKLKQAIGATPGS